METKKFNNVDLFKDKQLNDSWKAPFDDEHKLEVKGDKARVHSNNPFAHKPSAYRKLKLIKKVPNSNKSIFRLSVNGQHAFFKVAINLPKGYYYGK
jgi:hypothetical protein